VRVYFIVNCGRRAKQPAGELLAEFERLIGDAGLDYRIECTQSSSESRERMMQAVDEGFDQLWIAGGDGSINKMVNATFGRDITYGIVPMGTMNALARSLGIPVGDPVAGVRYLLEAKPRPIDVVQLNEHYLLCFCSIGYHADVVHGISRETKRHFGKLAFWTSGVRAALNMSHLPRFDVEYTPVPDLASGAPSPAGRWPAATTLEHDTGYSSIISNICNYAGFGVVRPDDCSSRYLELHLFHRNGSWPMLKWFTKMNFKAGRFRDGTGDITHTKAASCLFRSERPMLAQIDGEAVELQNPTEIKVTCLAGAARILLREPIT
jgi:diacylglycerol kinase family enzyme